MLSTFKVNITTDSSGNATAYLDCKNARGLLLSLIYVPGTIATGADLTITTENRGIPILTKADAGTSNVVYNPRAKLNEVADGAAGSAGTEMIPIYDERIKVEVAQGGDTKVGSIEAILLINSPY